MMKVTIIATTNLPFYKHFHFINFDAENLQGLF